MIESINIAKVATYGEPQAMDRLGLLNFVFGTNGAGKTTISRVLANPAAAAHKACHVGWRDGAPLKTLVYNRDFVDANFSADARLKGIFTLGEQDIANEAAIEAKKAEVARWSDAIAQFARTLDGSGDEPGKLKRLAAVEDELRDRCWDQKRKHDAAFSQAFVGVRGDAVKFKEKVLLQAQTNAAELKPLGDLTKRAETVFGPAPEIQRQIPSLGAEGIVAWEADPILAKKIVGKEDVDIAELIHRLGHSDWVKEGQALYGRSAPDCPFCQQKAPGGFEKSLADYFDETFERDVKALGDLQTGYDRDAQALIARLRAIADMGSEALSKEEFGAKRAAIEATLLSNGLILARKRKEPSAPQALEPLGEAVAAMEILIGAANEAISRRNEIASNIGKEKVELTAQVWRHLLDVELKADLERHGEDKRKLEAAITSLRGQSEGAGKSLRAAQAELRALEKAATSVQPTVDAVNALLKSFGFKTFALAKAGEEPFYKLVRHDGRDAQGSLSEGEKSFVTFLYFYHLVKGSDSESGMSSDRVVVFDDPVSSLDSEVLFIVSSLIRSLFDDARGGRGAVKQVFVMTHNVYFHKEVSYLGNQERKGDKKGGPQSGSRAGAQLLGGPQGGRRPALGAPRRQPGEDVLRSLVGGGQQEGKVVADHPKLHATDFGALLQDSRRPRFRTPLRQVRGQGKGGVPVPAVMGQRRVPLFARRCGFRRRRRRAGRAVGDLRKDL